MLKQTVSAALILSFSATSAVAQDRLPTATKDSGSAVRSLNWVRGAPVRLMVVTEINSRDAKAGDRFKLRVDAPVIIDNQVAIPVGAAAWAEVINSQGTGAAGGRGRVSLRLLYVETPSGRVQLSGSSGEEGKSNTSGVVMGVLGFGLLGLLVKGGNAVFKAGDIVTGYIDEGPMPENTRTKAAN